jgi:hypothetical protein
MAGIVMPKRALLNHIKRIKTPHKLTAIIVILAVAGIGTYLVVGSHAATPYVSTTADNGSLSNGVQTVQSCTGASDGSCTYFKQSIAMDGSVGLAFSSPGTPFSPSSFWNTPLPADTPTNTNSGAYVTEIANQLCYDAFGQTTPMTGACTTGNSANGNLNTARWSSPFYVVPANQPRVPIILNATSTSPAVTSLQTELAQGVPIPANAVPAGGTDAHLSVYQPSSDTLWEFWRLSTPANNAPGAAQLPWSVTETAVPSYGDSEWHAVWGGVMTNVSTGNGIFPNPYAGWTTGLPLLGTVVRIEELQAGQIDHAIGIGLGQLLNEHVIPANTPNATNGISWPADRSDGTNTSSMAIPEGLRFRLPASLNLTQYAAQHPLTPVAMAIAVAVQKYGFVVAETANGPVGLGLGDPTPYTVAGLPNPYTSGPGVGGVGNKGLFGGVTGDDQNAVLMANFPWSQLQALPFNYGEPSSS